MFDKLFARFGNRDFLMAEEREHALEEIARVLFIVGNGNPQAMAHVCPRGNVTTISAPGPFGSPTRTCPPCAWTISYCLTFATVFGPKIPTLADTSSDHGLREFWNDVCCQLPFRVDVLATVAGRETRIEARTAQS
jgi:hypothetical protein